MKLHILCFYSVFLLASCSNNNNTPTTSEKTADNAATKTTESAAPAKPASADDITGHWKLAIDAYDQNDDEVLQDEERKKGVANNYDLQLNADGTCRMQNIFTGRYTIKTENGNKILTIQRKRIEQEEDKDPLPDVYRVTSQTSNELVLLTMDGNDGVSFWIFKRV